MPEKDSEMKDFCDGFAGEGPNVNAISGKGKPGGGSLQRRAKNGDA